MNFKRLGVFATPEQVERVKHAQSMPMMAMTNPAPPGEGVPHAVPMFRSPIEVAHSCALEQGLPEIAGYYGIDLENSEFLVADDGIADQPSPP